jgi:lipid-A-disaccharide synthase
MKPRQIMVIAGEASGDALAAELVLALRDGFRGVDAVYPPYTQPLFTGLEPRFFGAGGPRMKAAGVELAFDMTEHSVIGLSDVLKNYLTFRRLFKRLFQLALDRQPDAIICVDFSGFNRRFAHAIKSWVRRRTLPWFRGWNPKIVQFVSPQVWASREGRAYQIAEDYDLLLSIFPFEKEWYAGRVPKLRVEFVGHPMLDRYQHMLAGKAETAVSTSPNVLLLPGSRVQELRRHLPVMLEALDLMRERKSSLRAKMVLSNQPLVSTAQSMGSLGALEIQVGNLPDALRSADLAIASTGTVTMECACFGVPAVTLYKTSWSTYQIGRRIVKVKSLTMPNLLAGEEVYPEFIQNAATAENVSRAALDLLDDESRRQTIQARLTKVIASLGGPGATRRAASAVVELVTGAKDISTRELLA